jgi:hypothetical protein
MSVRGKMNDQLNFRVKGFSRMSVDTEQVCSISGEYQKWKAETLAKQQSHKEGVQRTGLWMKWKEGVMEEEEDEDMVDQNEFVVELAPGWR